VIALDYDKDGNLVGIDNAGKKTQLKEPVLNKLPSQVRAAA